MLVHRAGFVVDLIGMHRARVDRRSWSIRAVAPSRRSSIFAIASWSWLSESIRNWPLVTTSSPGSRPGEHLGDVAIADEPGRDLARREAPVAQRYEDELAGARAQDRLGRQHERALLASELDVDRGEHAGLEAQVGVRELEAHGQRARFLVEGRIDVGDAALDEIAPLIRELHLRGLSHLDPRRVVLVDLGLHPHLREIADGVEVLAGRDAGAFDDVLVEHEARTRRADGERPVHPPGAHHRVDVPRIQPEQIELASRGAREPALRSLRLERQQVLLLGGHEIGRVDLEERRAPLDRRPGLVGDDLLDPAGEPQVHDRDAVLADDDLADRAHVPEDGLPLHAPDAHAHVLDHDRVDRDRPVAQRARAVGVDGDQFHAADRARPRRALHHLRMHAAGPELGLVGALGLCRIGTLDIGAAGDRAEGEGDEREGEERAAYVGVARHDGSPRSRRPVAARAAARCRYVSIVAVR